MNIASQRLANHLIALYKISPPFPLLLRLQPQMGLCRPFWDEGSNRQVLGTMDGQKLRYICLSLGLYSFLINVLYLISFKIKQTTGMQ